MPPDRAGFVYLFARPPAVLSDYVATQGQRLEGSRPYMSTGKNREFSVGGRRGGLRSPRTPPAARGGAEGGAPAPPRTLPCFLKE